MKKGNAGDPSVDWSGYSLKTPVFDSDADREVKRLTKDNQRLLEEYTAISLELTQMRSAIEAREAQAKDESSLVIRVNPLIVMQTANKDMLDVALYLISLRDGQIGVVLGKYSFVTHKYLYQTRLQLGMTGAWVDAQDEDSHIIGWLPCYDFRPINPTTPATKLFDRDGKSLLG